MDTSLTDVHLDIGRNPLESQGIIYIGSNSEVFYTSPAQSQRQRTYPQQLSVPPLSEDSTDALPQYSSLFPSNNNNNTSNVSDSPPEYSTIFPDQHSHITTLPESDENQHRTSSENQSQEERRQSSNPQWDFTQHQSRPNVRYSNEAPCSCMKSLGFRCLVGLVGFGVLIIIILSTIDVD